MAKASKEEQRKAPILRFKGFTDAWEQRELGNLLKINSGKDYKHLKKGDIPVYGTSGYMLSVNESLSKNNAIGIGRKGTIDKPQLLKAPFWTVDTLFFLTLKHTNDLNFIYYKFQNINWKKYDESTGVPSLTKNTINKIKINIPELDEQNKIKLLFKSLDNLITLYERKKQLLTWLKQGTVNFLITKNGQKPQLRFSEFNSNWESKSFEKLLNYEQPTKYIVKNTDYISKGTPVLTANKSFILGYTNETNVYQNIPAIIFDDFTLESKYVDFPFMIKSSAIKILTSKNSNLFFIYQLLISQNFVQEGHSRHYISVVQKKKVLVPSIQEQNKIGNLIKQLEDNIELNSSIIALLKRLKDFLLQNMFL